MFKPSEAPSLPRMDRKTQAALREAKAALATHYGKKLRALLLYGSRARGTARPDSDIDLLVVLEHLDSASQTLTKINDLLCDAGLHHGVLISAHPVSWRRYQHGPMSPFLERVRGEGVAI